MYSVNYLNIQAYTDYVINSIIVMTFLNKYLLSHPVDFIVLNCYDTVGRKTSIESLLL